VHELQRNGGILRNLRVALTLFNAAFASSDCKPMQGFVSHCVEEAMAGSWVEMRRISPLIFLLSRAHDLHNREEPGGLGPHK